MMDFEGPDINHYIIGPHIYSRIYSTANRPATLAN